MTPRTVPQPLWARPVHLPVQQPASPHAPPAIRSSATTTRARTPQPLSHLTCSSRMPCTMSIVSSRQAGGTGTLRKTPVRRFLRLSTPAPARRRRDRPGRRSAPGLRRVGSRRAPGSDRRYWPVTAKLCKVAIGGWSLQKISVGFPTIGQLTPKADFSAVLRALAAGEGIVSFEGAIVLDA